MEDRALSCLLALRRVLGAAERNDRALARATGLTTAQLLVLRIIEDAKEITPKGISTRAGVAPASATALIEKLAQLGYLRRRRSESDRRKYWVSLTEAGVAALHSAPDPLHQRFSSAFDTISNWEQAMILSALERVAALVADEGPDQKPADVGVHNISSALSFPPEPERADPQPDPVAT
ncbi:DNA-binding MarR family transcriptional regulator [Breoghania corrubedonensis]|uniref:DNA-binding MarR family transcriptional regulator n=1 Tax=Breoghania corrubedonensis TaxID=665038 RepID=A0A2T5UU59_9HYPH|nr:MarR family transcriptional regulator [Breoghania corrubedonensis]PTW55035.1 DNA-binding MarR family transcriptional regulator [Breoghania corrubedonensis]